MELGVQFPQINHKEKFANIRIAKTKVEGNITITNINRLYPTATYIFVENNGKDSILKITKTTKNKPVISALFELKNGVSAIPLTGIVEFLADSTDLELNFVEDFDGFVWIISNIFKKGL